jgi:dinuclear metal center YbgI/SA1388 family protein
MLSNSNHVMDIQKIIQAIDNILEPDKFSDYAYNGLQVEGARAVETIVSGVSVSQELIEKAIAQNAQMILVHHGIFWQGDDMRVVDMVRERLKLLLENNINLVAYHLPLDAHPTLGNNAELARLLDLEISGTLDKPYIYHGKLKAPATSEDFASKIDDALGRKPQVILGHDRPVETIAWCSGGAQKYIKNAASFGVDAFLSGEVSEPTFYYARELGINYYACGHHATERYGVQALGRHLSEKFDLNHTYIEVDNPI